jgi:hypothetical protein
MTQRTRFRLLLHWPHPFRDFVCERRDILNTYYICVSFQLIARRLIANLKIVARLLRTQSASHRRSLKS